ncbi:MAG: phosphatase PAP2 family protein [Actinoplanes sp.]
MSDAVVQTLKRIILPVVILLLAMIGLGLLITKVWNDVWPFTSEDSINRGLVEDRDGPLNAVSYFFSFVGSTPCIIGVTAIIALILRLTLHRWREPIFLCAAVTAQALVFFFTTLVIDRKRPTVNHMDDSPPTSSFPSGHTSAAVALYIGLAVVLFTLLHQTWAKWLVWALVLVPIAVAVARLYRGMHHPTDVTASFVNGITCVTIMARGILDRSVKWTTTRVGARPKAKLAS